MTETEILEAISRSGYLFESEIAKFLSDDGYFVESNVIFQDPLTGKNREIDIVAETYNSESYIDQLSCKISYFFELKNNNSPLVLLTQLQFNPNTPEDIFKEILSVPDGVSYEPFTFFDALHDTSQRFFTQYCSFTWKKDSQKKNNNQLMASHSEELYSSLSKLCWYCEKRTIETQEFFDESTRQYFRHWLNLPVLLINDDLYELMVDEGKPKLEKVKFSRLLVNFHFNDRPSSTVVYVVTKNHLNDWLMEMNELENSVRSQMKQSKLKSNPNNIRRSEGT